MGLIVQPGNFNCSYGKFSEMTNKMALAAGYAVWPVFVGSRSYKCIKETVMIDWGHITSNNLMGIWDEVPSDPLLILLAHHDHTGVIKHEHCMILCNRIEEVRAKIAELELVAMCYELQKSLEIAHDAQVDLQFT